MELKTYLAGILKVLDKDYDAEEVNFDTTEDGYVITFKSETGVPDGDERTSGGDWYRNVVIDVKLGTKYFTPYERSSIWGDCCKNCKESNEKAKTETKVKDKDKVAPSG